ncbi:inovirus Gp2 family protein [Desulfovibrio desulfuricans]|uniref:YagK/YfjJ domain-containing protein n=1 Tax=Desulfovibrio desulfuricans TaxID=876 RepID=UPI001F2FA737|nr:inovirus-type Gp2 protein [Desulfovibrio desulfuricans]UIA98869.1 inovirus Gp2 family protein [Desulfovibrio desulfuricans]
MSKITTANTYRGYPINTGKNNNLPCSTKCLDQLIDTVEYLSENHSRVLAVRADIHSEQDSERILTRRDITRVIENTKRNINSRFKDSKNKPDIKFIVTTEQTYPEANPHYHVMAFANGNAIQNGYSIFTELNKQVKNKLDTDNDGLVHFSGSNGQKGIMIDRNSDDFEQQMNNVVYAGSYLAKTKSKEHNPKGSRVSSSSIIKKNNDS